MKIKRQEAFDIAIEAIRKLPVSEKNQAAVEYLEAARNERYIKYSGKTPDEWVADFIVQYETIQPSSADDYDLRRRQGSPSWVTIARYAGLSINYGILVSEVEEGSSAAASGILGGTEPVQFGSRFNPTTIYLGGDIITGLDNISVRTYADYTSALESKRPGDSVTVTVFRNGEFKK